MSKIGRFTETEHSLVITWGWEKGREWEGLFIEEEFPLGVVKIFWN